MLTAVEIANVSLEHIKYIQPTNFFLLSINGQF